MVAHDVEPRIVVSPRRPAGSAILVVSALTFGLMAFIAKRATVRLPGPEVAFVRFVIGVGAVAAAVAVA